MAYCWQLLLPFAFLQIIINGLALAYDWPDWTISIMSLMAAGALVYLTYRAARQSGVTQQPSAAVSAQRVGSVL
jgi:hypothetical protein